MNKNMSIESAFQEIENKKIGQGADRSGAEKSAANFKSEKEKRMSILKKKLRELDKTGKVEWEDVRDRIAVKYDEGREYGRNFICSHKDKEYNLSLGDIMADYNWGIKYAPDSEMSADTYRKTSKRILINEARRDIEDIYDKEIIENRLTKNERKGAVKNKLVKSEISVGEKIDSHAIGLVSEEMVREFITRLSYDISKIINTEIKIIRSNIKEDVRQKIDFKIQVFSHKRGVKTVSENELEKNISRFQRIGFQLATKGAGRGWKGLLEHKEKQMEKAKKRNFSELNVDDIILIGLNMHHTKNLYDLWFSYGKPPGGPESLWDVDQRKKIFRAVTDKLKIDFSDGELEKILK